MKSASALSAYVLTCPKCGVTTEDFPVAVGLGPKYCAGCKGMWFERGQLAQLVGTVHDVPDFKVLLIEANLTAMTCPSCKKAPLLEMPYAKGANTMLHWCNGCGGMWVDIAERKTLQAIAEYLRILHHNSPARKGPTGPDGIESESAPDDEGPLGYRDFRVNLLALPIAAVIVWFARVTVLADWVLEPTRGWLHDLGHALGAVMASHSVSGGTSWWLALYFTGLAIFVAYGYLGWKERRWFAPAVAGLFILAQAMLTFALPPDQVKFFVIASGFGGEIIVGTLLIVTFYYRQPQFLQWNFWRWAALVVGLFSLVDAFELWSGAVKDPALLWNLIGIANDGDLMRLRDDLGSTQSQMANAFLTIGIGCHITVALHYLYFLITSTKNRIG